MTEQYAVVANVYHVESNSSYAVFADLRTKQRE